MSFSSSAAAVSLVPEFLAYTEPAVRSLPRTFAIQSLSLISRPAGRMKCYCVLSGAPSVYVAWTTCFVTGLEGSLCRLVVRLTQGRQNGFSWLLREVIVHSGASSNDVAATKAHCIHVIATSSEIFFF